MDPAPGLLCARAGATKSGWEKISELVDWLHIKFMATILEIV
jgi:hypothetical protein